MREIRLFEGFASFRPKGVRSSHEADVIRLREVAWNPERCTGAVVAPEDLALTSTDVLCFSNDSAPSLCVFVRWTVLACTNTTSEHASSCAAEPRF